MINSNDYGNYTIGENKIVLSENLLGGGREASAKLATVMSHEGSHYNGNRVEAIAHLAGADTYSQLNEMFKLQADTSFSMEMVSGIMNADNWKENTGDVDHWKIEVIKGHIYARWDESQNITLPNGTIIKLSNDTGKISASKLSKSLFGNTLNAEIIENLFQNSSEQLSWDEEKQNWFNKDGETLTKEDNFSIDITSIIDSSKKYSKDFDNWLTKGSDGQSGMEGVDLYDSSTLNSINMLGYTTSGMNQQLAKDIWNEKLTVEYGDFEGNALGRADRESNTIYISDKLLGGGKEGSAQIASMFSHEGLHLDGYDELQSRVGGYDTYAQLQKQFGVTGESYDSISDIAYMTEVYKQYGEEGLFTELFFGDIFSHDNLNNDLYLSEVLDPDWRQNEKQNKGIVLGNGYTEKQVEEYNKEQKTNAYNKYKNEQYALYLEDESVIDKKTIEEFTPNVSLTDFTDEDAKKYGYKPTKKYDLYGYACTLSTAAYIAYSITGELTSLKDANSLLAKNDVFAEDLTDNQKNLLNYGSTYAKAINVLSKATLDVIEYESSFYKSQNVKDMENYLLSLKNDINNEYFVHLRTNSKNNPNNYNYHSVLLDGIDFISTQGVPDSELSNSPTIKLNIIDPAGQYTQKDIYQIGRADAYKLTEYGRVYKGQYKVNVDHILNYVNQKYYLHNYYKYCYGVNDYGY